MRVAPHWDPALEAYPHEDATTGAHTITDLRPVTPQPIPEQYIPPSPPQPGPPGREDSPLRDRNPPVQKDAEPTTTVQYMPKPLTRHHAPDNYHLPREGNHTHRISPTWRLPKGTIDWKEIRPGVATVEAMDLIATKKITVPPAEHLFITIQGTATIKGGAFGDDD